MPEYIEREALMIALCKEIIGDGDYYNGKDDMQDEIRDMVSRFPAADVAPVRHGLWILEAHDERVNYRWNVTAECSECCDERKEIWAGFFPNIDPSIARSVALASAKSVKLSNYCPNCGAKMDLEG